MVILCVWFRLPHFARDFLQHFDLLSPSLPFSRQVLYFTSSFTQRLILYLCSFPLRFVFRNWPATDVVFRGYAEWEETYNSSQCIPAHSIDSVQNTTSFHAFKPQAIPISVLPNDKCARGSCAVLCRICDASYTPSSTPPTPSIASKSSLSRVLNTVNDE
jgi:hypothetical protein